MLEELQDRLIGKSVTLYETDWEDIIGYAKESRAGTYSAALRTILQEWRELRAQKAETA